MVNNELLAGVIVLYNPKAEEVIANITSYLEELEVLIAVDNSDKNGISGPLEEFFRQHPKVVYHSNGGNQGIANALNVGADIAVKMGYKWLLTMDQDSAASPNMLNIMTEAISASSNIGIISPIHGAKLIEQVVTNQGYEEVESTMTSGNLLNLEAYKKVGPFDERLFIDYVDHEYCLRLKKNGYKIVQANGAVLDHNLGSISKHKLGATTNHSFVRRYYITRNRFLVRKIYRKDFPSFCKRDFIIMWKELAKICLYEKDKFKKVHAFLLGFYHYKLHKFGKTFK